jgi:hypothetical protein
MSGSDTTALIFGGLAVFASVWTVGGLLYNLHLSRNENEDESPRRRNHTIETPQNSSNEVPQGGKSRKKRKHNSKSRRLS